MRTVVINLAAGSVAMAAATIFPLPTALAGDIDVDIPYYLTDDLVDSSFAFEIGQWKLVPSFSASAEYTDNVKEAPARIRDFVPGGSGSVELRGQIGKIDTSLTGSIWAIKPVKTPSENDYEGDVTLDLRRDFGDSVHSRLKIAFADFRPGYSTDSLDHEHTLEIKPSVSADIGKYKIELLGTIGYDWFPGAVDYYGDPTTDTRQHKFAALKLIASQEVTDKLAFYLGALLRGAIFDSKYDLDGYRRGSLGFGVFAGLRGDLAEKLSTDVSIGYVRQTFLDVDFPTRDYVSVNGSLQWRPTDKIRLTALFDTGFTEAEDYGAAGILSYAATLRAEYQATAKLVLVAEADYENADYLYANVIERTTDLSTGFDYALWKHSILSMRYKFRARRSDDPDEIFDRNAVSAAIRFN